MLKGGPLALGGAYEGKGTVILINTQDSGAKRLENDNQTMKRYPERCDT
jgi:hypothetical protein